ncbi:Uncharacterised protein [Bordetella pertussis]|nr:Uncharacterised protein [Bordetella pertussis]
MRCMTAPPRSANAPIARSTRPASISRCRSAPCRRSESMRTPGAWRAHWSIRRGMK